MGIQPPEPGIAIREAQTYPHDPQKEAFATPRGLRWLAVQRGVWVPTDDPTAYKISAETYEILRAANSVTGSAFTSGGVTYQLIQGEGCAVAEPA